MSQTKQVTGALLCVIFMVVMLNGCRSLGLGSVPLDTLKVKYSISERDFISVKGIDIHYKEEGHGPVLLLLHGICSSLYTWDGWVDELKGSYRIIRLDLPGWGMTGPAECSMDLDEMIEVLHTFVHALGVDSFYLAGNSLGGYFAWNYALEHPGQVKKMVLLDPVCYPQTPPWFIRIAKYPSLTWMSRYMMPRWMVSMNIRAVYGDTSRIDDQIYDLYFDLAMRKGNKGSYMDAFRYLAEQSAKADLARGVPDIKPPVLLMYGSRDKWVPPSQQYLWKKDLPGLSCIVYEGVGHVPMEEIPVRTARDADAFLAGPVTSRFSPLFDESMDGFHDGRAGDKGEQGEPPNLERDEQHDREQHKELPEEPGETPGDIFGRMAEAGGSAVAPEKTVVEQSQSLGDSVLDRF